MQRTHKIRWTLGNLLVLMGAYVLVFIGGLRVNEHYNVYVASGANDVAALVPTAGARTMFPSSAPPIPLPSPTLRARETLRPNDDLIERSRSVTPLTSLVPAKALIIGPSTVTRIVIPRIKVDRKVVEVGWTVQQQNGQNVAVWDVETYRVGHHRATSNPGAGGNIVLAGHSGGRAYPFNDIYYLKVGDQVQLFSNGKVYPYTVSDHILLDEEGQPPAKRLANLQYLGPTTEEMITMVACWPLTGPDKFKQRIVIRAKPAGAPFPAGQIP